MSAKDTEITCPYCYATITVALDTDAKGIDYVEDCSSCCNPIHMIVSVAASGEIAGVEASLNQ
mgnify:CR=1 FL=1